MNICMNERKQEMARLDALLAEEAREEAAALAPLLRQKDRVWAAINGYDEMVLGGSIGWMGAHRRSPVHKHTYTARRPPRPPKQQRPRRR